MHTAAGASALTLASPAAEQMQDRPVGQELAEWCNAHGAPWIGELDRNSALLADGVPTLVQRHGTVLGLTLIVGVAHWTLSSRDHGRVRGLSGCQGAVYSRP